MNETQGGPGTPLSEALTRREREVLALLAQGFSAPEIAGKLVVALSSAKSHIQHVYGKLGVNGKRQALNRALELGLIGGAAPRPAAAMAQAYAPMLGQSFAAAAQQAYAPAPAVQPPARPAPRHNLPLQVTRFFGREAEIDQLRARLAEQRLVTLIGSGGVGKTRLALQAAEAMRDDFADGVWLVELAPLTDPALVVQQTAAAVGARADAEQPVLDLLCGFVRERQVLLVLDNCEHLLEACARLAEALLRAGPRLRILASSREPLAIAGEAVFPVPSLSFPDAGHLPPIDKINGYDAVRLFVDRARLVRPNYELAAHNAAGVARICQRLDGIPLAIEMAAARVSVLNAEQLAQRLDDAFRVLTGGSRTALPRQQTLRAMIDWSYKLLNESERLLLQRMSVFAGGCTLEAAEGVCAEAEREAGAPRGLNDVIDSQPASVRLEPSGVLDVLASLVAKSMVDAERRPGAEPRYRLLETVRQYAREKLQDGGESVDLHRRHRDYFLRLAEDSAGQHAGREASAWAGKLRAEQQNLHAALEWAFSDEEDAEAGPRLVSAVFWSAPFSLRELNEWCRRAVAWCHSHPDISETVYAGLLMVASCAVSGSDLAGGVAGLKESLEIHRRLGPTARVSLMWNLTHLAGMAANQGEIDQAVAYYSEAQAVFYRLGPESYRPDQYLWIQAFHAGAQAGMANRQGRYQQAKLYAAERVRLLGESGQGGDRRGDLYTGEACLGLGEYEQARENFFAVYERALKHQQDRAAAGEDFGDSHLAYAQRCMGLAELRLENLEEGLGYCQASLREASKAPHRDMLTSGLGLAAAIRAKQGQMLGAATLAGAAQALYARQHRQAWEDSSLDTLLPGWRAGPFQAEIAQAFEAGQGMSAEQATALALSGGAD